MGQSYIAIEREHWLMYLHCKVFSNNACDSGSCSTCVCLPQEWWQIQDCFYQCYIPKGRTGPALSLSLQLSFLLNKSYIIIEFAPMVFTLTKCLHKWQLLCLPLSSFVDSTHIKTVLICVKSLLGGQGQNSQCHSSWHFCWTNLRL